MEKYSELQRYRDAIKVLDKRRSKYDTKKSYSSFWMEDRSSRFSGLGDDIRSTNDTAKLIKLGNYQRAIANFVKIVTKREIPVTFMGDTSYTNGQAVNLTTDIKDNNFDVIVGLALHEGSHIVLSDFDLLKTLRSSSLDPQVKDILNWIEDRRIDQYIFSTSPGYRAYYHKMYDYYWNDKVITKALLARKYRTIEEQSYMFQIVNSLNPAFEANALPGLQEIINLIDVRSIARLENTTQALEIAVQVWDIIKRELANPDNMQPQLGSSAQQVGGSGSNSQGDDASEDQSSGPKSGQSAASNSANGDSKDDQDDESLEDDGTTAEGEDSDEAQSDSGVQNDEETPQLTDQEERELEQAMRKQRKFLNGETGKKGATSKKMISQIKALLKSGVDMQAVNACGRVQNGLIYDYTVKPYGLNYATLLDKLQTADTYGQKNSIRMEMESLVSECGIFVHFLDGRRYATAVQEGVELGALLGRKLQVRNESRSLEYNRLTTGRIDNKRLAHAGYGVETIFNQIHVDRYKRANLHISLDASGSMSGTKWADAVRMTAAICKAVTYTQNVSVQVSVRGTHRTGNIENPVLVLIYDSRKNHINQLVTFLRNSSTFGTTPEGICYEMMIRKNMIPAGNSELDSYLLNISDGMPEMSNYAGPAAREHTRCQVEKLRNDRNVGVLSFFVYEGSGDRYMGYFREMYGRDSVSVEAKNVIELARVMNNKFLSHGKISV